MNSEKVASMAMEEDRSAIELLGKVATKAEKLHNDLLAQSISVKCLGDEAAQRQQEAQILNDAKQAAFASKQATKHEVNEFLSAFSQ